MKKKITWILAASMNLSGGRLVQRCPDRQTYLSHTQVPATSEERQQAQSVLLLCLAKWAGLSTSPWTYFLGQQLLMLFIRTTQDTLRMDYLD